MNHRGKDGVGTAASGQAGSERPGEILQTGADRCVPVLDRLRERGVGAPWGWRRRKCGESLLKRHAPKLRQAHGAISQAPGRCRVDH